MRQELDIIDSRKETVVFLPCLEEVKREEAERDLLLRAFEMFTQASGSLELAFSQLQDRAHRSACSGLRAGYPFR